MPCYDPVAYQSQIFGASVQSISASIGWNGAAGYCDITVAEDPCAGTKISCDINGGTTIVGTPDRFNPQKLSCPVAIQFGNFYYGGILQSWEQSKDLGGKTFNIKLVDPSFILAGTQIILDGYTGQTFGIPNLINVYAFLEYFYGTYAPTHSSLAAMLSYTPVQYFAGNTASYDGLSWNAIKSALSIITNSYLFSSFGSRLKFRDWSYYLDLSEIPYVDNAFRISGDCLSILELVDQVCEYTGRSYFVELIKSGGYNFIKVRTTSRKAQPIPALRVDQAVGSEIEARLNQGAVTSFVGDGTNSAGISRGLELRKDETTNCIMVGDYRSDIWQITYAGSQDGYSDTIWPYWGLDANNYPIIAEDVDDYHNFTLDATGWGISGLSSYNVDLIELRAATEGMSFWESVAKIKHPELISLIDLASEYGLTYESATDFKQKAYIQSLQKSDDIVDTSKDNVQKLASIENLAKVFQIYGVISNLAQNYMGKKYMVGLPFIASAVSDTEPFAIKLNFKPTDSGWSDFAILNLSLDSVEIEKFRNEQGKLVGFAYFQSYSPYTIDLSQLPTDAYISISPYACYVKCSFDEIVFLDPVARTYPRAVITMPGTIGILRESIDMLFDGYGEYGTTETQAHIANVSNNRSLSRGVYPLLPRGAAVPIQSTTLVYGPWYSTQGGGIFLGPAGKTTYLRDTGMSPWNFGSTALMNAAGTVSVNTQVTLQQVIEMGSLNKAGLPLVGRLGNELVGGGPEVTDIRVSIDLRGVTTQYGFKTYTPSFGVFGKVQAENIKLRGQMSQKTQRLFKQASLSRKDNPIAVGGNSVANVMLRPDRYSNRSASTFLIGEYVEDPDNSNWSRTTVGFTDLRKCLGELEADNTNYVFKAGMETGGLFRPFTTKYNDGSWMPSYKNSTATTECRSGTSYDYTNFMSDFGLPPIKGEGNAPIVVTTLSPFITDGTSKHGWEMGTSEGHDIEYIVRDGVYPTDLCVRHPSDNYSSTDWYRAIALRGPLIIAGWGYDIYGKPVPNQSENTSYFKENWLRRPQDWKCGPVDLRWDENRGVWTPPVYHNTVPVKILSNDAAEVLFNNTRYGKDGETVNEKERVYFSNPQSLSVASGDMGLLWYDRTIGSENYKNYNLFMTTGFPTKLAKLNGSLSAGGSASASVWAWNGSAIADTGEDVTVYDWLMKAGATAIASGKKIVFTSSGGINIVTEAECP